MGLSAIVADPAVFQRRILRLILQKIGISVEAEAGSAFELGALLEAQSERVVFFEAAFLTTEETALPHHMGNDTVAFIATGTETSEDDFVEALQKGARNFLLKPYTIDSVRKALLDADLSVSSEDIEHPG